MGEKVIIGGYVVSGIEMVDDNTCAMYFEDFTEDVVTISIVVEKWLNDDSWHFNDSYFELNGDFIDSENSTHLLDADKEKCKEFINTWIEDLDKKRLENN